MKTIDLLVVILIAALLVFTAVYNIRKKRRGEKGCAYCDGCGKDKKDDSCPH